MVCRNGSAFSPSSPALWADAGIKMLWAVLRTVFDLFLDVIHAVSSSTFPDLETR